MAYALDVRGNRVEVTPGEIDLSATYLYKNGQCLAFAMALQDLVGGQLGIVTEMERSQADDFFDCTTGSPEWEFLTHMVLVLDDQVYDIDGHHGHVDDFEEARSDDQSRTDIFYVDRDEVEETLESGYRIQLGIVPQDIVLARTFAEAIAAEVGLHVTEVAA